MQQVARLLTGYARMSFRAASAVTIDGIQLAVPRDYMTGGDGRLLPVERSSTDICLVLACGS